MTLIEPHGGTLVDRVASDELLNDLIDRAEQLPSIWLAPWEAADLDMIASGALSPLTGFMDAANYHSTLREMRLASGLPWSLPVTLRVAARPRGSDSAALRAPDGSLLGVIDIRDVFDAPREEEARFAFGTTDSAHPGVKRLLDSPEQAVGGDVVVLNRSPSAFPDLALDPRDTRREFTARGWSRVVGFQTRNPVHRAHEYIQKAALETVDGLLLHPLVGSTKEDDVPADIRVRSYRVLLENYYPRGRVLLAAFPAAMRYAGPREAIFHAIARKNYGCSHFVVGRDHAGVGNYYGTYDAQKLFARFTQSELGIQPVMFEHAFFCKACDGMASAKTCPHDGGAHVTLSGTRVRELLRAGELPPREFSRPEVARVLVNGMKEIVA